MGAALAFEKADIFLERHDKSVIGAFTIVLAISTIGLWLATNKLWSAGERQLELLAETSAAQSSDMKASIAAAAEANRISSEGFHAAQRAWVTEETVTASDLVWDKHGCELVVKTTVRNIGIAPAQEVVIDGRIVVATPKGRSEYTLSDAMNEVPSGTVGHLLFPNADFAPSKRLKLTREQIDKAASNKEVAIKVIVIVRYLSTMDRKGARTIRFYDLKRLPVVGEEISYPLPINVDENVRQGLLLLTQHWMPSYAD